MKKTIFAVAISLLAASQAMAAGLSDKYSFIGGLGYMNGGDTISSFRFSDGGSQNLKAGSGVVFTGGVNYRVNNDWSVAATVGYQVDRASASNGDAKMERVPLELAGFYHINDKFRIGAALRKASNVKYTSSGAAYSGNYDFDSNVSPVIEAEYMTSPQLGIKLRYVSEKYKVKGYNANVDANHFGISAAFYY